MLNITRDAASFIKSVTGKDSYKIVGINDICIQILNDPAVNPDRVIDAYVITSKDLQKKNDYDSLREAISKKHPNSNIIVLAKKKTIELPGANILLDPNKDNFMSLLQSFKVVEGNDATSKLESFDVANDAPQEPVMQTPIPETNFSEPVPETTPVVEEQRVILEEGMTLKELTYSKILKKLTFESNEYKNVENEIKELNSNINKIICSDKTSIEKTNLVKNSVDRFMKLANNKSSLLASYAYNLVKTLTDAYINECNRKFVLTSDQINRLEAVNITGLKSAELDALMANKLNLANELNSLKEDLIANIKELDTLTSEISDAVLNTVTEINISAQKYVADTLPYMSSASRGELRSYLDRIQNLIKDSGAEDLIDKLNVLSSRIDNMNNLDDTIIKLSDEYIKYIQTADYNVPGDAKIHFVISASNQGNRVIPELLGIAKSRLKKKTLVLNFVADLKDFKSLGEVFAWEEAVIQPLNISEFVTIYSNKLNLNDDIVVNSICQYINSVPDAYDNIIVVTDKKANVKLLDMLTNRIAKVSLLTSLDVTSINWVKAKLKKLEMIPKLQKQIILNEASSTDAVTVLEMVEGTKMLDLQLRVIPHFYSLFGQIASNQTIDTIEVDKFIQEISYAI